MIIVSCVEILINKYLFNKLYIFLKVGFHHEFFDKPPSTYVFLWHLLVIYVLSFGPLIMLEEVHGGQLAICSHKPVQC